MKINTKKSSTLFIICFILVFFSFFLFLFIFFNSCQNYNCLIFPGKSIWKEKKLYENSWNTWKGILSHPEYLIKLEIFSKVSSMKAALFTKTRLMNIEGLYADARSPYPGALSDKITCGSSYKPTISKLKSIYNVNITYFKEYLNDRFQTGMCVDDQVIYKGFTAIFYCQEISKWFQLEIIVDKDIKKEDDYYLNLFKEIGCQRPSLNIDKLFP